MGYPTSHVHVRGPLSPEAALWAPLAGCRAVAAVESEGPRGGRYRRISAPQGGRPPWIMSSSGPGWSAGTGLGLCADRRRCMHVYQTASGTQISGTRRSEVIFINK